MTSSVYVSANVIYEAVDGDEAADDTSSFAFFGDGGEVSWVTDQRYGKVTLFLLDCCKKRLILTTDERKDEVVGLCRCSQS